MEFTKSKGYDVNVQNIDKFKENEFSQEEAQKFINDIIKLDKMKFKDRDFQLKSFIQAIRKKRMLLISPTSSGKSLIMYMIIRYLLHSKYSKKILIIVPTINLVEQLQKDFVDYGWDAAQQVHKIYQGKDKNPLTNPPVTISTWQSLYPIKDNKFFEQFDTVIRR